ncbi:transcriptional activator NhaR [Candidatus Laterigemmans baculatus]|uniref:transcriptional activator NhaR n=1 Tax=Candidatus Laterigemmans baculatus TaxID=2770505 RepID=UPI0013D91394|nr:transcriptional activator NhaR [Candidatus Laterigemmans baculatus]
MDWLNYHHLHYFWMVARTGSVAEAARQLHLTSPTLSSQIRKLEESLGAKLFRPGGRRLTLTDTGQTVFEYAEQIFSLGRELAEFIRSGATSGALRMKVGATSSLPKLVIYRLLQSARTTDQPVQILCREAELDRLLADLVAHRLDVVLSDAPAPSASGLKVFNHALGQSAVAFFAHPDVIESRTASTEAELVSRLRELPMLLPPTDNPLRRGLEQWFDTHQILPRVVHEIADSALLKVFGQAGDGVFPAPAVVAEEICRQYDVVQLGQTSAVQVRFFAISTERQIQHPAVVAVCRAAQPPKP